MQIPFYDSHFYIGFPVLLWLAYDSYKRYRKNQNVSTLYIALASLALSASMFCFGFPALFTNDPKTLSFFTFMGDALLAASLLFMWLLSIRAFLSSKPKAMLIANTAVILLAIACIVDAIVRNLSPPYSTSIVTISNISSDIVFTDSLRYNILVGINSLSLFLLSFYFWRQGSSAPNSGQKLRIRAMSLAFLFTSMVYIMMPASPLSSYVEIKDIILSTIFIIIGASALISYFLNRSSSK